MKRIAARTPKQIGWYRKIKITFVLESFISGDSLFIWHPPAKGVYIAGAVSVRERALCRY